MARDKPGLVYLINSSLLSAGPHRTGSGTSGATALPPPKGPRCTAPRGRASQEGSFSFRVGPAGLESQPDQIRSTCRPGEGAQGQAHALTHSRIHSHTRPTRAAAPRPPHTPHTPPHNSQQPHFQSALPPVKERKFALYFIAPGPGGFWEEPPSALSECALCCPRVVRRGAKGPGSGQFSRQSCPTPRTAARQSSLSITNFRSLLKLMSIESVMPTMSSSVVPFSSVFNLSQHQGLFKSVSSSRQVAKVLEFQLQHQSFQWIFRIDFL